MPQELAEALLYGSTHKHVSPLANMDSLSSLARGPLLRMCGAIAEAAEKDKQLQKALQAEEAWMELMAELPRLTSEVLEGTLGPSPPLRPGQSMGPGGSAEEAQLLAMLQGLGMGGAKQPAMI